MENTEKKYSGLTLLQIINGNTKAAAILEKYNLDLSKNGVKTIRQVCEEKGILSTDVFNDLDDVVDFKIEIPVKIDDWELDAIVDYIINNHHKYVRTMIPVITTHTEKIASTYGKDYPEMVEVARIFSAVYKELKQHMMKEEEIIFPYIKYLVKVKAGQAKFEKPYFGRIGNPINMMELEHQSVGEDMYTIRKLLNNYAVPAGDNETYKLAVKELKEFEEDHLKHVHLENHLLFPKAVILEEQLLEVVNS